MLYLYPWRFSHGPWNLFGDWSSTSISWKPKCFWFFLVWFFWWANCCLRLILLIRKLEPLCFYLLWMFVLALLILLLAKCRLRLRGLIRFMGKRICSYFKGSFFLLGLLLELWLLLLLFNMVIIDLDLLLLVLYRQASF